MVQGEIPVLTENSCLLRRGCSRSLIVVNITLAAPGGYDWEITKGRLPLEHDGERETFHRENSILPCLYALGTEHGEKFFNGGRALSSVLKGNVTLRKTFADKFRDRYRTMRDSYLPRKGLVIPRQESH